METINTLKNSTFYNITYDSSFTMPMHAHQTYELMYINKGTMVVSYKKNNEIFTTTLINHQFVLININIPHKIVIPDGNTCNILNIEFSPSEILDIPLNEVIMKTEGLNRCESIIKLFNNYFDIAFFDDTNNVKAIINQIHILLNNIEESYETLFLRNNLLNQLFISISKSRTSPSLNSTSNIYIYQAITYIEQNYQHEITIDDIANHISLNKSYLQRLFKKETGQTIVDEICKYRIEKSKRLLENGFFSIEDISKMVGIKNRQTFTKMFIKYCKISPNKYKSQNTNKSFQHYSGYKHEYKN